MTSVIFSRVSFSGREGIAPAVAERLGYRFVSREALLELASGASGIPADRLLTACTRAPSFFGMSGEERKRNVAHIQAALSGLMLGDEVAYEGRVGHMLLRGISHIVKVRIAAPIPDRVRRRVEGEGLPERRARQRIEKEDEERRRLSLFLFGLDEGDPDFFDLRVDTSETAEAEVVDRIEELATSPEFKPMTYSIQVMRDFELAHRVRAALVDLDADVMVTARSGHLKIRTRGFPGKARDRRVREIERRVSGMPDVGGADVEGMGEELSRKV